MFSLSMCRFLCVLVCGMLLAACSPALTTQPNAKRQRQLESAACKLISVPPEPAPGTWEAISVKATTLSALEKTDDGSLQHEVRAYDVAASAQNTSAMIRALAEAVRTCHRLGVKTGT